MQNYEKNWWSKKVKCFSAGAGSEETGQWRLLKIEQQGVCERADGR